jgi:hypothetical protein
MQHGDVGIGALLPPDQDSAKSIHPTMGSLNYPPAHAKAGGLFDRFYFFTARPNVSREFEFLNERSRFGVVVALVEAEILRLTARRPRTRNRNAFDRLTRELEVVDVGARDCEANRDAARFRQQTALRATLGSIRWIGAGFFPHPAGLSSSHRPSTTTASRCQRTRRSHAALEPKPSRRHLLPSIPRTVGALTSSSKSRSHSMHSIGSRYAARTRSHSSHSERVLAPDDSRAGAAFYAAAATARFAPIRCPEFANDRLVQQVPSHALAALFG